MQDLKALEGKSLAELREIGKALGIPHLMMKKKDLIEKILNFTQDGGVADTETQQSPAEAPKKTRRPRIAKTESTQAEPIPSLSPRTTRINSKCRIHSLIGNRNSSVLKTDISRQTRYPVASSFARYLKGAC